MNSKETFRDRQENEFEVIQVSYSVNFNTQIPSFLNVFLYY